MVGQGHAVLAAGAGWVGYVLFFLISSFISSFSNASSVGVGHSEILWSRPF